MDNSRNTVFVAMPFHSASCVLPEIICFIISFFSSHELILVFCTEVKFLNSTSNALFTLSSVGFSIEQILCNNVSNRAFKSASPSF